MFELIFGSIWTAFVTPIFLFCLFVPGEQRGGADMNLPLFAIFVLFEYVGIYVLTRGLKTVIKDIKTKKYGIECYGIVSNIKPTGARANNNPEFKAIIDFINPETNEVDTLEEIIGFNYNKYPVYTYVLCKYYQGDINIEHSIPEDEVPSDIKKYI